AKAAELGSHPSLALYNAACDYAHLGSTDKAVEFLERALARDFRQMQRMATDANFASIRDDPRVKRLLGTPPQGLSRDERWRHDIDFLLNSMEKVHYRLYAKVTPEALKLAANDLKDRVGSLKDEEIAVGIQGILTMVGDGHTALFALYGHMRTLPVHLFHFKEGLLVLAAAPEHADIVGGKVLR